MLGLLILALFLGLATPALADKKIEGLAQVHDGDTIRIGQQSIRIWGIDAVELKQTCLQASTPVPCGEMARDALKNIIGSKTVTCTTKGKSYKRVVGQCFVNGRDVAAEMTRAGMAYDYARYSKHTYANDEAQAKSASAGIWAMTAQNPADWRACHLRAKNKRPASC